MYPTFYSTVKAVLIKSIFQYLYFGSWLQWCRLDKSHYCSLSFFSIISEKRLVHGKSFQDSARVRCSDYTKKHHIPGQCYDVLYCRQTKDSSYYELKQCSTEYQKNKEELYQHFKSKGLGAWKKQINMDSFELIWLSLNTHDLSKICISNTVICHDLEYFIHFDICWIKVVYWNTNTV